MATPATLRPCQSRNSACGAHPLDSKCVDLFGIRIHAVDMSQAVAAVSDWLKSSSYACRYVVTPNVDHIVKLQSDSELSAAYARASLILADGWPLVAASRVLRKPLPERVAGSDLVPTLFNLSASTPLRVFLLGAGPGVAEIAQQRIQARWPHIEICGTLSPPLGFEHSAQQNEEIVARINACRPDLLVVGLGAPKQEIWLYNHCGNLKVKAAIAAGATIDFLAGEQKRAPIWVQRIGLEWFHRAITHPRRLARRYMHGAWAFPKIVAREWIRATARSTSSSQRTI